MKQVAILGGSFDPVHLGHVQMARFSLEHLGMDEVWFLPNYQTPLKDRQLTENEHRLHMLEIAINGKSRFKIETYEMDSKQKCYTVDTLKALKKLYPDVAFSWLIGNDQLKQFSSWKDPDTLVQLANFICFDRDGDLQETCYDIRRVHMPMVPVSSSDIRKGNKLNYLNLDVYGYILEHRLYVKDFLVDRLGLKRRMHCESVANLCEDLARCHGLNTNKAYLIGLFHDIAKHLETKEQEKWMQAICPENMHWPVPVWHGFVGAEILKRIFFISDPIIYNAIYHHVLGDYEDPYAMIVYVADKLDPCRGYDSSQTIQLCKQDLVAGFVEVHHQQDIFIAKEGK